MCKIKFGDNLSAVFEVKKAYTLLLDNQKKYPDFKPNVKSLGLLHTIFGAVPDKYKFGAKLLGLKVKGFHRRRFERIKFGDAR